ncbi:hypothetical protein CA262_14175 [Sphingobium sp. GW456-12-10-14-TSB1]|uniref:type IV toxin-antitoxin system AbiEi family antitoxin n=1 Tax=Sphingobium TaxID=165695 RepID=UPI0004749A34|nr:MULTISPECIES: type IV toxin-antitoxin system AbiEi family antitoxin [Sphingobium]OUC55881.1 hypothetical protein CA262_14175 [Sphingobium sp. GW456-12-10-14-TSB1]
MDEHNRQPLNRLMASLPPGLLVDSAWLKAQGISRTSIHDYVQRGWLDRVAPRVYRRTSGPGGGGALRWEAAVVSAQRFASASFHVGGTTALELLGLGHFARLGSERAIHLYDPEGSIPTWLPKLPTEARFELHKRQLFAAPALGIDWRRLDLGTTRLGGVVPSPEAGEPWDHFLRIAGAERAAIEMMDGLPDSPTFDHADTIFESLTTLRPRLLTQLLETCTSIRAKRLFLFFADRHHHSWEKHVDRANIDLGRGKRQLVAGGRLDARYQITVPAGMSTKAGEGAQ